MRRLGRSSDIRGEFNANTPSRKDIARRSLKTWSALVVEASAAAGGQCERVEKFQTRTSELNWVAQAIRPRRPAIQPGSWDRRHFGGFFPLPFGRGEGQGEGLGGGAERGIGQWLQGFSPSPRPSPPPRGRGRRPPRRRRWVRKFVAYPRDLSVWFARTRRPALRPTVHG